MTAHTKRHIATTLAIVSVLSSVTYAYAKNIERKAETRAPESGASSQTNITTSRSLDAHSEIEVEHGVKSAKLHGGDTPALVAGTQNVRSDDEEEGASNNSRNGRHEEDAWEDSDDESGDVGDNDDDGSWESGVLIPPSSPSPTPTSAPASNTRTFTMTEVAAHNNAQSCYTVIGSAVYDVTSYVQSHPGGASAILSLCGKDGTSAFQAQHGGQGAPASILASFMIGGVVQ